MAWQSIWNFTTQERLILFKQQGTQQGDPLSRCSCHQNGQDPSLLEAGRILHLYTQPNPITMQLCNITNANGPYTPMHIWGNQPLNLKILEAPIGNQYFEEELFNILATKIENDLSLLQQFPYLHQRTKLLTFRVLHQRQAKLLHSIP